MIDELLSPERIQPLEPKQGAADLAWEEIGRRRRTRTLRTQVAVAACLVVVVMVGLLPSLQEVDRPAQLDVAGPASGRRVEAASPDAKAMAREEAVTEAVSSNGGPGRSADAPSSAREPGHPAAKPADARAPSAARAKPPANRTRYETVYVGCLDWCLSGGATRLDEHYELAMDLCVAVGGRTRRFSFATTQELDLSVARQNAAADWTWSAGQRFPANEHHLDIGAGECAKWTVLWDATDEKGERLPPGRYTLSAKSLAEQAEGATSITSFDISE